MLDKLKELLIDLRISENDLIPTVIIADIKVKIFSLETAIEILENLRKEKNEK